MFTEWEAVVRLVVAGLIGGFIGMEREVNNRAAGLRTHTLVCVGSALIMMVSIYLAETYQTNEHARIAAQVVSGIGFLGAGTILVRGLDIQGLTTAASLWVAAGIGLAVGAGFYVGALVAVAIVIITLFLLRKLENKISSRSFKDLTIHTKNGRSAFDSINKILDGHQIKSGSIRMDVKEQDDLEVFVLHYEVYLPLNFNLEKFVSDLEAVPHLLRVEYGGKSLALKSKHSEVEE